MVDIDNFNDLELAINDPLVKGLSKIFNMDYLTTVYSRSENPKLLILKNLLINYLRTIKNKEWKILEVGCGNCDLLNEFYKIGLDVIGTDLLETAGIEYDHIKVYKNNIEKENYRSQMNQ